MNPQIKTLTLRSRFKNNLFDIEKGGGTEFTTANGNTKRTFRFADNDTFENSMVSVAKGNKLFHESPNTSGPRGKGNYRHDMFFRRVWEYIIFLVTISPFWEVSFFTIFFNHINHYFYFFFILCDILVIIDTYIVSHTSYLVHGVYIHEIKYIIRNFGFKRFYFYCFSALPISWIGIVAKKQWVYFGLACLRLPRFIRAINAASIMTEKLIYFGWFAKLYPLLILLINMIHLFACIFYLVAYFEGEDSWVYLIPRHWDTLKEPQKYVVSIYFVMTTILAIGFGDMTPQTSTETIVVIFIQLIGVLSNAYIIGQMVALLLNPQASNFVTSFQTFMQFCKFKKIPTDLQNEIKNCFGLKWEENHGACDPREVNKYLPETLKNRLRFDETERLLRCVGLFRAASPQLIMAISCCIDRVEFVPGELILQEGELSDILYLFNKGIVRFENDSGIFFANQSCELGQAIGELELFVDQPRSSTIKAVTHVSGWTLSRQDFQLCVSSKPELKEEVLNLAKIVIPGAYKDIRRLLAVHSVTQVMEEFIESSESSGDVSVAQKIQKSSDSDLDSWVML